MNFISIFGSLILGLLLFGIFPDINTQRALNTNGESLTITWDANTTGISNDAFTDPSGGLVANPTVEQLDADGIHSDNNSSSEEEEEEEEDDDDGFDDRNSAIGITTPHSTPSVMSETEITLVGGILTITDINGGNSTDELDILYDAGTNMFTINELSGNTIDATAVGGGTGTSVTFSDAGVNGLLVDVKDGMGTSRIRLGGPGGSPTPLPVFTDDVSVLGGAGLSLVLSNTPIMVNGGNIQFSGDFISIRGNLSTTGSGSISLDASEGSGSLQIRDGINVTSADGDITLRGDKASTPSDAPGVHLFFNASVTTTGSGNITVSSSGNNTLGFFMGSGSSIDANGTGTISVEADILSLNNAASISGSGTLTFFPFTAGSIGVGGAAADMVISDAILANVLTDGFSSIIIGDATKTTSIEIQSANFTDPVQFIGTSIFDTDDSGNDVTATSVTLDGSVIPGSSPGIFAVSGDQIFADNSSFDIEVLGTDGPGDPAGHDQIAVTGGGVTIGNNVSLTVDLGSFSPIAGDVFVIVDNDGGDPITTTFNGLAEGASVPTSNPGISLMISYMGGDGNDIELFIPPSNCMVSIDRVTVSDCFYDPVSMASQAAVEVEVSWVDPPGPIFLGGLGDPRMDRIEVTLAGQTKYIFQEAPYVDQSQNIAGYKLLSSPQIVTFFVDADNSAGNPINAEFELNAACNDMSTYDAPAPCIPDPCVTASGTLGGSVFEDFNANGAMDAGDDKGIAGITVNLFGCNSDGSSISLGGTTTDENGDYFFLGLDDNSRYRLEFIVPPSLDRYEPTSGIANNYTTVQFAMPNTCGVNLGLNILSSFCQANPMIMTTCYARGSITSTPNEPTIVGYPYDAESTPAFGSNPAGSDNVYYGLHGQTGAVWGLAYDPKRNLMYSSAVLRRHVGLGPLGLGGLYVTDLNSGMTNPTFSFIDLDAGGLGFDFGTEPPRNLSTSPIIASIDPDAFDDVGKMGIGDIEMDAENDVLYVTNLSEKKLYKIDLSNYVPSATGTDAGTNIPGSGQVTSVDLPDPCGSATGEMRPWGLSVYGGEVYIGLVCDASVSKSEADLRAYLYSIEATSGATSVATASFTQLLNIPLTYPKGSPEVQNPAATNFGEWRPWEDDPNNFDVQSEIGQTTEAVIHPQPIFSDIEFDKNGDIVIAIMDRASALQLGSLDRYPDDSKFELGISSGDVLRGFKAGSTFVLENNAEFRDLTGYGPDNFQGPGFGEFYNDDYFQSTALVHSENGSGALAVAPGSGQVVTTTADPVNSSPFAAGTRVMNNTTGLTDFAYAIYSGIGDPSAGPQFGKAGGIGDVEVLCQQIERVEVGNYLWIDTNMDGIQDPCEDPLEGVNVTLYDDNNAVVSTVQSNPDGFYYFENLDPEENYTLGFGSGGQFSGGILTVNGLLFRPTQENTGMSPQPDLNDSNPVIQAGQFGDIPIIPFLSSGLGSVNHSFDFGLICETQVEAGKATTICATGAVAFSKIGASIIPASFTGAWSSSGNGIFLDGSLNELGNPAAFGVAEFYRPSAQDSQNGRVTLTLTSDPTSQCGSVSDDVEINILNVNCGDFPWDGE